jgi:hypothetical protein
MGIVTVAGRPDGVIEMDRATRVSASRASYFGGSVLRRRR